MKRIFFAVFSIVMLVSCNQSGQQNTPAKNDANQSENREVEKVRRPISFSGTFYQITNIGSPDIVFTEGDYSIEAEGPSSMVNAVNIDVDCNVLTVSMNNEERIGTNQFANGPSSVTLYISCPSLQILATCGTGGFRSVGTIHNSDMHVGCLGTGTIELDTVVTTGTFKYESSGDGDALFHHIRADQDCNLLVSGRGNTTADVDIAERLLVENDNSGTVSVSGKAHKAEINILETSDCNADLNADQLDLTALRGNITLKGKYAKKNINQSKKAQVTIL